MRKNTNFIRIYYGSDSYMNYIYID